MGGTPSSEIRAASRRRASQKTLEYLQRTSGVRVENLSPHIRIMLGAGLCVIERDNHTVQIGCDPPRSVVVHNLPAAAGRVLAKLDGRQSVAQATKSLQDRCGGDAQLWRSLLAQLISAGVLQQVPRSWAASPENSRPVLAPDRSALTWSFGPDRARLYLQRRAEAKIQIIGAGRVGISLASILAASGIGHLHLQPDRALEPADCCPAGLPAERDHELAPEVQIAQVLKRANPRVITTPIRDLTGPDLVVLAGDGPADSATSVLLIHQSTPHLAVYATAARGRIGPMVLPGRSSCLGCEDLHRLDWDPSWPTIRREASTAIAAPPGVLTMLVAASAADQVLQFIDGRQVPATVNGTLEWQYDSWQPRRRTWQIHPQCPCQRAVVTTP